MATDNETSLETEKAGANEESIQDEDNQEYDYEERQARDKLKRWQARQAVKGLIDNTINRVLENYATPSAYSIEVSRFQLFRGSDMENTAVMMAIRNHGLVQPADILSHSQPIYSEKSLSYSSSSSYSNIGFPRTTDQVHLATTSSSSTDFESFSDDTDIEKYYGLDSDQQETFLERAVAEAIKKKGLSALSVD